MNKQYIGDGVYAEFDGFQIRLFTSNGYTEENEIYLEPSVMESLIRYYKSLYEKDE